MPGRRGTRHAPRDTPHAVRTKTAGSGQRQLPHVLCRHRSQSRCSKSRHWHRSVCWAQYAPNSEVGWDHRSSPPSAISLEHNLRVTDNVVDPTLLAFRRAHILRLIAHADTNLASAGEARMFPTDLSPFSPGDPVGDTQARAAWMAQTQRSDVSAVVLGTCRGLFEAADKPLAAEMFGARGGSTRTARGRHGLDSLQDCARWRPSASRSERHPNARIGRQAGGVCASWGWIPASGLARPFPEMVGGPDWIDADRCNVPPEVGSVSTSEWVRHIGLDQPSRSCRGESRIREKRLGHRQSTQHPSAGSTSVAITRAE